LNEIYSHELQQPFKFIYKINLRQKSSINDGT